MTTTRVHPAGDAGRPEANVGGPGIGWLQRKYGLACDNLRAADMLMTDGGLVQALEDENPGSVVGPARRGGNFGIVTSMELDPHPVGSQVFDGLVAWPAEEAREVLTSRSVPAGGRPWHTRRLWEAAQPFTHGGAYVNFLGAEGTERVRAAYGEAKFRRLQALKRAYDPDNVFRINENIPPGAE